MANGRPERDEVVGALRWDSREVAEAWRERWSMHEAALGAATERMLDLAGVAVGGRVLDVAAGTGEQTLAAARRVGPAGSVLATDVSADMLAVAADVMRREGWGNVETLVADARRLALKPGSFDAAISRFGVMLVPTAGDALTAIHRTLKPGGRLAAMVWSAPERNPFLSLPLGIRRDAVCCRRGRRSSRGRSRFQTQTHLRMPWGGPDSGTWPSSRLQSAGASLPRRRSATSGSARLPSRPVPPTGWPDRRARSSSPRSRGRSTGSAALTASTCPERR
jgi:SAM-dependent methyltransferase